MLEATLALGVSHQTVLQRVKRGELQAVHVRTGRRKGLRINVPALPTPYSDHGNERKAQCDDASNAAVRSASRTHARFGLLPMQTAKIASIAS